MKIFGFIMADLCSLVKEKCGFMLSDDVNSIISGVQLPANFVYEKNVS